MRFWSSGRFFSSRTLRSIPTCSDRTPPGNSTDETSGMMGSLDGTSISTHSDAFVAFCVLPRFGCAMFDVSYTADAGTRIVENALAFEQSFREPKTPAGAGHFGSPG